MRKCEWCDFQRPKGRRVEFERHVKAHYREERAANKEEEWVCCGIPWREWVASAEAREPPNPGLPRTSNVYRRQVMVGGCMESFARKETLVRHLAKSHGKCIGDPNAPYVCGNTSSS
ncbi:hypothetical protein OH77DRAFT_1399014 [Trametes cingulata]|nr:hypothetical protein OH77DRAFT_1399014 [Trametes cingulata]